MRVIICNQARREITAHEERMDIEMVKTWYDFEERYGVYIAIEVATLYNLGYRVTNRKYIAKHFDIKDYDINHRLKALSEFNILVFKNIVNFYHYTKELHKTDKEIFENFDDIYKEFDGDRALYIKREVKKVIKRRAQHE